MSGGVFLQSPTQLSGRCNSNGVIVPPHPSSKLQGDVVTTIGGVLTVLLEERVGVGGQKYTSLPSIPKYVGDDGVRSPLCFFNIEGESVELLGTGDRTIGSAVLSCGMFSCEDDGLENTTDDG